MKLSELSIKKIAVFRALQLGDLLCAIPAVRSLRKAYPAATITLISLPWAKALVNRFPAYFDEFIHFPGYPGLPEQPFHPADFLQFLTGVQGQHFDLVLQMQGNGNLVNPMVELFGAASTAGFFYKDVYYPENGFYLEYPENCHEIERHLRLMEHLGIITAGTYLEFPLFDADHREHDALQLPIQSNEYVCIHPGSRGSWRQWPPAHFATLADYCAATGLKVIITGTREELGLVHQVNASMQHEAIVVAGRTSLGAVALLIKNARLLISNCTGVSHIAAAVKTPGIVISMDGEPERWAPLNHEIHKTFDWTKRTDFNEVMQGLQDLLAVSGNENEFRDNVVGIN